MNETLKERQIFVRVGTAIGKSIAATAITISAKSIAATAIAIFLKIDSRYRFYVVIFHENR